MATFLGDRKNGECQRIRCQQGFHQGAQIQGDPTSDCSQGKGACRGSDRQEQKKTTGISVQLADIGQVFSLPWTSHCSSAGLQTKAHHGQLLPSQIILSLATYSPSGNKIQPLFWKKDCSKCQAMSTCYTLVVPVLT